MRLLIIEDSPSLIKVLRSGLQSLYHVDAVRTGSDGLHEATTNTYDAIVMDLGLPDMTGQQICQQLRREGITTPILILTADAMINRKVELLDSGADDYLTKPFSMDELTARLRVLLRRSGPTAHSSRLSVGDLVLDTSTRRVERSGTPIPLRRKEYEILEYMMHHAGMIVTRAMILDHAWEKDNEVWANAVDVHIKHLRDKIDRPFPSPLIKTIYGLGYKLETSQPVAPIPQ